MADYATNHASMLGTPKRDDKKAIRNLSWDEPGNHRSSDCCTIICFGRKQEHCRPDVTDHFRLAAFQQNALS